MIIGVEVRGSLIYNGNCTFLGCKEPLKNVSLTSSKFFSVYLSNCVFSLITPNPVPVIVPLSILL